MLSLALRLRPILLCVLFVFEERREANVRLSRREYNIISLSLSFLFLKNKNENKTENKTHRTFFKTQIYFLLSFIYLFLYYKEVEKQKGLYSYGDNALRMLTTKEKAGGNFARKSCSRTENRRRVSLCVGVRRRLG